MNRKIIGIVLGLMAALALSIGVLAYMATYGRSSTRLIGENVSVSSEWNEVPVDAPLRIRKQIQEIVLVVDGARFSTRTRETLLARGVPIEPMVELKDKNGQWHNLQPGSGSVNDYDSNTGTFAARGIEFRLNDDLSSDIEFVAVRIRSPEPFLISKVYWHVYYMK